VYAGACLMWKGARSLGLVPDEEECTGKFSFLLVLEAPAVHPNAPSDVGPFHHRGAVALLHTHTFT